MQKFFVFILIFLSPISCTKSIRYTEDEIQNFPPNIQENIRKGEVVLGMTTQQVRYSLGSPNSIKYLDPLNGKTREEWIYSKLDIFSTRLLIFLDGKLIYIN